MWAQEAAACGSSRIDERLFSRATSKRSRPPWIHMSSCVFSLPGNCGIDCAAQRKGVIGCGNRHGFDISQLDKNVLRGVLSLCSTIAVSRLNEAIL